MFGNPRMTMVLGSALLLAACATAPRDIETPTGQVPGMVSGPFVVLGVADRATSTLNRANALSDFVETVHVDAPLGTQVIVPVLRGWTLGYGSTDPADHSPQPAPESTFRWNSEDHHFGIGMVNIAVIDLNAAVPGAISQSATVQISARLNDDNGDDKWWGVVRYELIFLGPAAR